MTEHRRSDARVLRPFPGRSFAFSPEWEEDEATVLFDCNSGDYWIISPLARQLVLQVATSGGLDADAIIRPIPPAPLSAAREWEADLVSVIRELVQREILIDG